MQMQQVLQNAPYNQGTNDNKDQLSWTQLLQISKKKHITEQSFHDICQAYISVDRCLQNCESVSENSARLRKTYAGIRFICIEHKKEFFTHLPCLAENEPTAMAECKNEINQSLISSSNFGEAIVKREQHNIRNRFSNLCRDLKHMIRCIKPVTYKACGGDAARIMMKFITIGFTSFEQLYSQLGVSDHLPATCKSLVITSNGKEMTDEDHDRIFEENGSFNQYNQPYSPGDTTFENNSSVIFSKISIFTISVINILLLISIII
uniref:CPG4 domain-containing protein n=1 Tax=Rhabditophanes sp. KR3021 TaxID=114890 RepID=A0AC35TLD0_9BILA